MRRRELSDHELQRWKSFYEEGIALESEGERVQSMEKAPERGRQAPRRHGRAQNAPDEVKGLCLFPSALVNFFS